MSNFVGRLSRPFTLSVALRTCLASLYLCAHTAAGQDSAVSPAQRDVALPASALSLLKSAHDEELAGRLQAAEVRCREALQQATQARHSPLMAAAALRLASVTQAQSRYQEAEQWYRRGLSILSDMPGPPPAETAMALLDLGTLLVEIGRYGEAEQILREVMKIQENAPQTPPDQLAATLGVLALLARYRGEYTQSERLYLRAVSLLERTLGPTHADVGTAHFNLAILYIQAGRWDQAERQQRAALASWRQSLPPAHPSFSVAQIMLADLLVYRGRWAEAEQLLQESLAQMEASLGQQNRQVVVTRCKLADLYRQTKRAAPAIALLEQSIPGAEQIPGPALVYALAHLALLRETVGSRDEAIRLAARAVAVANQTLGPDNPASGYAMVQQAHVLRQAGRKKEAKESERQGQAILARNPQGGGIGFVADWRDLLTTPRAGQTRSAQSR